MNEVPIEGARQRNIYFGMGTGFLPIMKFTFRIAIKKFQNSAENISNIGHFHAFAR